MADNDRESSLRRIWTALGAPRANGRLPPYRTWLWVAFCVVIAGLAQSFGPVVDRAAANIATLIFAFLGSVALLVWFSRRGNYPPPVRLLVFLTLVGVVVIGVLSLRIDETSGNLIPTRWRFAWMPKADQRMAKLVAASSGVVDLMATTGDDYPEFLGPGRKNALTGRNLAKDWTANPPKLLWKHEIGAGWSAFSVVNGYAVTMEQRGEEELVTCYEARTGKLVWSYGEKSRHETILGGVGPRSTPTIYDGNVYALSATGVLRCLIGSTGMLQWRYDLLEQFGSTPEKDLSVVGWGRAASPLIVDNLVVVPAGGPPGGKFVSLIALDRLTGEKAWEGGDRQVSYSSPVLAEIAGVRQILIVNEDNVSAHDPADGHVLWQHPWPGNSTQNASASQAVALPGDRVLLTKAYGNGALLLKVQQTGAGGWEATEVWANTRVLKTKFTNVAVHKGFAFGLSDGILECVDLESGRSRWKKGRYEHGQLLLVDDILLVLSESGELVMVDATPEAHFERGRFPVLEGKTWNNLCLAGRLLLVRNGQEAACYELP